VTRDGVTTDWTVYIVRCADDTLYTGIARNAARRVEEHNAGGRLGARYTRARRPVELVYQEAVATRSEALKREYRIKQLSREEKERMVTCGTSNKNGGGCEKSIEDRG
jgi:putative endonuclease